jgi:phosphoglycerol transferase MdoB-like AlkP superfamily enzyme
VTEIASVFFFGLRFDSFSIAFSNALFILLSILPFSFFYSKGYQYGLKFIFLLFNTIFILVNCIDLVYFSFIKKRSTVDIVYQTIGGQTDVLKQIPYYFKDFWYVFIIGFTLIYLFYKSYNRIKLNTEKTSYFYSAKSIIIYISLILFISGLTLLGMRGGAKRVPIQLVDAGLYAKPQNVALVLNTPFTIMLTIDKTKIDELKFMPIEEAISFIKPIKEYSNHEFKGYNVVCVILEGFSKEYTGIGNRKSYTPFLDSLMGKSLVFTNAWANGTKSIEGVAAILSSIPNLLDNPYINSSYCDNNLSSLASLLKTKGYTSSFFHGGMNGTMNFDAYSKTAGFDNYFGKNEYPNQADFDGNWGIWDEPYLKYVSKELEKTKQPFFSSIFTLSSHHPYKIPDNYSNKFPKGDLPVHESIGYADYALKQFFTNASKTNWYANTLFVILPDHTGISADPFYANNVGQHSIPILFFNPNDTNLVGENNHVIQQIDILPSVLDYLGYNERFFSFGQSIFSKQRKNYGFFYDSGNYYLTDDSLYFTFNNYETKEIFHYKNDSTLAVNSVSKFEKQKEEALFYLKSFNQLYNYGLINNKTNAENFLRK